jgi:hypothetical protein
LRELGGAILGQRRKGGQTGNAHCTAKNRATADLAVRHA